MSEDKEITMEDIREVMALIDAEPEEIIFQDDFQIILGRCGFPTKIRLKEKGVKIIEKITGEKLWQRNQN